MQKPCKCEATGDYHDFAPFLVEEIPATPEMIAEIDQALSVVDEVVRGLIRRRYIVVCRACGFTILDKKEGNDDIPDASEG